MLKKISLVFFAIILTLGLVACGTTTEEPTESAEATVAEGADSEATLDPNGKVAKIKAAGKLVLATSPDYPPYEFRVDTENAKGEVVGFDIDFAKEIAKDLGVELEIIERSFDNIIMEIAADKADIGLSGFNYTEERAKVADFSKEYYKENFLLVIKEEDAAKFVDEASLKDMTIGVQSGTTMEATIEKMDGVKGKSLKSNDNLILEVKSGNINGVLLEASVAKSYVAQEANKGLAVTAFEIENPDAGFVAFVNKGNTDLVEVINGTIDRLEKEGKLKEFFDTNVKLSENAVEEE